METVEEGPLFTAFLTGCFKNCVKSMAEPKLTTPTRSCNQSTSRTESRPCCRSRTRSGKSISIAVESQHVEDGKGACNSSRRRLHDCIAVRKRSKITSNAMAGVHPGAFSWMRPPVGSAPCAMAGTSSSITHAARTCGRLCRRGRTFVRNLVVYVAFSCWTSPMWTDRL